MDFDYFFAADVFVYGDLIKIFDHIKNNISKRCCLIFSTELSQGNGFKLENQDDIVTHILTSDLIEKLTFKLLYFVKQNSEREKQYDQRRCLYLKLIKSVNYLLNVV